MSQKLLDVIIPSYNNPELLIQCLTSFALSVQPPLRDQVRIWVVNNGDAAIKGYLQENDNITVLEPGKNLGWEGGLKYALERCQAPFVAFSNDDVRFMEGQHDWLWKMLSTFNNPHVAAVGPSSNFVMGSQNIFYDSPYPQINAKFLIGFFFMLRRSDLDAAGGVDDTLPGGDDLDLSIRLRDLDKVLVARRDVFVYHFGSMTGNAVHPGYWNSGVMQERTTLALIKKHGMLKYWDTVVLGGFAPQHLSYSYGATDIEGELCAKHAEGDKILELGCGGRKTVPNSIGVDVIPEGQGVPHVHGADVQKSKADVVADVSQALPFDPDSADTIIARHVLEHCQDPLGTLATWNEVLKQGGKLIVAVPNPALHNTILQNPEHCTSYVPSSLRNLAVCAGFEHIHTYTDVNGISFVSIFQKFGKPYFALRPAEKTVQPLAAEVACA